MKDKKNFYLNLLVFIGSPIVIAAGIVVLKATHNNRIIALGGLIICFGAFMLSIWSLRVLGLRMASKERKAEAAAQKAQREKRLADEKRAFESAERPQVNTLKAVQDGIVFNAEGRYVCRKDFKGKPGYHFAFEASSTDVKSKPDGYDGYLEDHGVLVSAGYFDGEALEEYANDNGILLTDEPRNLLGQTVTLQEDEGYHLNVWTAEGDDADFGFVQFVKCEGDVLTVYFRLHVPYGLCDTIEGTVELKKDDSDVQDIDSLITKVKRKRYNVIEVKEEELQAIEKEPCLPRSYIAFLREVGFADMDWIDVGRNVHTPTNLYAEEKNAVQELLTACDGANADDYYFFGMDNGGTYYAFSKVKNDGKVYTFCDDPPGASTYESFEEFLFEILNVG